MNAPEEQLKAMNAQADFFIGIDSDGCVFDTMEIKHKECFCPQFVCHFGMQPVSKFARETWEFVNLYADSRGTNRFPALIRVLDLLAEREEVRRREVSVPRMQGLRDWIVKETKLGNPALKSEAEKSGDPDLKTAAEWSFDVNETIRYMVKNIPPFPGVRECLEKMQKRADAVVVSQTPVEALEREWGEHGLSASVRAIAGQEMGTKAEHLEYAGGGKYAAGKMLMIGDALGDLKAAQANGCLFFPIVPGQEEASWQLLAEDALDRFFTGAYAGSYEKELITDFKNHLPETPPWRRS